MKIDRESLYSITQSILAVMVVVVSFYAILFGNLESSDGIYSIIGIVIGYYFSSLNSRNPSPTVPAVTAENNTGECS